jgi:hypothetical protein
MAKGDGDGDGGAVVYLGRGRAWYVLGMLGMLVVGGWWWWWWWWLLGGRAATGNWGVIGGESVSLSVSESMI